MRTRVFRHALLIGALPVLAAACSMGLTDVPDPSTITDPSIVRSQAGAVGLYNDAASRFNRVYAGNLNIAISGSSFVLTSGLASDEFSTLYLQAYSLRRVGPGGLLGASIGLGEQPYSDLHSTRLMIDQALGALKEFGKTTPSSYIAQLYAYRGYISIMFAEMYCSGVPFSRAIYGGDIVLGKPLTTEQMFEQAIADFDSAKAVGSDSVRVALLANVGKARALLNLKQYAQAAALVSEALVPTSYSFALRYNKANAPNYVAVATSTDPFAGSPELRVANRLGTNGLNYLEVGGSGGPDYRTKWYNSGGWTPAPYPSKFPAGDTPIPLADGLEARLIEAEAKLDAKDYAGWADVLNKLRQSAGVTAIPALPDDSTVTASQTLRENVMFRERAFWLYGTGHRLGDMRRLVRQYGRPAPAVFPIGVNSDIAPPNNVFSDFPNFAPPLTESQNNPNYQGCFNRDA